MGPFSPAKAMITGVIILVVLSVAAFALPASKTNSTSITSPRKPECGSDEYCIEFGLFCATDIFYDIDDCCCYYTLCYVPAEEFEYFSDGCYSQLPFIFKKNGTTNAGPLAAAQLVSKIE